MIFLNEILSEDPEPVWFMFKPTEIPVDEANKVVKPEEASFKLYSTLVFLLARNEFAVFEFDETIMTALLGYKTRNNGSLSGLELQLSRYPDGTLKIASPGVPSGLHGPLPTLLADAKAKNAKLLDKYLKFSAYTMRL